MRLDDGQIEVMDDVMAGIYREKTPAERLRIAFGLWRSASLQLVNCLHSLHPDWNEDRIKKEAAKRISHGTI